MRRSTLIMMIGFLVCTFNHSASAEPTKKSIWAHNTRWALDLSSRVIHDMENHTWSGQHVIGLDFHKVFSDQSGDYGTLTFQPYWVRLNNMNMHPFFFESSNDSELTWRIANFNYTGLSNGGFNIRLGHFEIPFGLEHNLDTNGTLRQYSFADRRIKADWGISLNGNTPDLDYEIALTRGSGNDISSKYNPYVFAGRVGTPSTNNLITGISWFIGDVRTKDRTILTKRLGLDIAYYYHSWEALFELSGGSDDQQSNVYALGELSWRNAPETVHLFSQLQFSKRKIDDDWDQSNLINFGLNWYVTPSVGVSGMMSRSLEVLNGQQDSARLTLQLQVRI